MKIEQIKKEIRALQGTRIVILKAGYQSGCRDMVCAAEKKADSFTRRIDRLIDELNSEDL